MLLALHEISRRTGCLEDRPTHEARRAVFFFALATSLAMPLAATAARADDTVRGLVREDGIVRFNGFRIEQVPKQHPPQHGGIPLDDRSAQAIMLPPPGEKRKVIVEMTIRYKLPEIAVTQPPAP